MRFGLGKDKGKKVYDYIRRVNRSMIISVGIFFRSIIVVLPHIHQLYSDLLSIEGIAMGGKS